MKILESTKDEARSVALKATRDYCDDLKKHPVILEEQEKYVGTMDEGTRNAIRSLGTATQVLGNGLESFHLKIEIRTS